MDTVFNGYTAAPVLTEADYIPLEVNLQDFTAGAPIGLYGQTVTTVPATGYVGVDLSLAYDGVRFVPASATTAGAFSTVQVTGSTVRFVDPYTGNELGHLDVSKGNIRFFGNADKSAELFFGYLAAKFESDGTAKTSKNNGPIF